MQWFFSVFSLYVMMWLSSSSIYFSLEKKKNLKDDDQTDHHHRHHTLLLYQPVLVQVYHVIIQHTNLLLFFLSVLDLAQDAVWLVWLGLGFRIQGKPRRFPLFFLLLFISLFWQKQTTLFYSMSMNEMPAPGFPTFIALLVYPAIHT